MEKIVVISRGSDHDSKLIECLKALFPDCEIDIQHRMPKNYDSIDLDSEAPDTVEINEIMEKYLSFL